MYTSADTEVEPRLKSNPFSLSGSGFVGAVGRSINLGGQTALALRLLLATFSSKISSNINRPFGDEFRAARKASEEISAQVVLGDRPIEITVCSSIFLIFPINRSICRDLCYMFLISAPKGVELAKMERKTKPHYHNSPWNNIILGSIQDKL